MEKEFLSRLGFLRRGDTSDFLKLEGKIADESDRLTILVMVGARVETHCLKMAVGIGSSSHCLLGELRMSLVSSARSVGRKQSSDGGLRAGWGKYGDCDWSNVSAQLGNFVREECGELLCDRGNR